MNFSYSGCVAADSGVVLDCGVLTMCECTAIMCMLTKSYLSETKGVIFRHVKLPLNQT